MHCVRQMLLHKFPAEMFDCWRDLRLCVLTSPGISRNIICLKSNVFQTRQIYVRFVLGQKYCKKWQRKYEGGAAADGECLSHDSEEFLQNSLSLSLSCLWPGADLKSKVSPNLLHSILLHSCYYKGANRRHLTEWYCLPICLPVHHIDIGLFVHSM